MEEYRKFISNLKNPSLYPHETNHITTVETHISTVILTGKYAYKLKKPVNLGFVDFTTLEKRKYFCEQEIKLNSKMAGDLYIEIVPIYGSYDYPFLKDNKTDILDYAIKMYQFPQENLLSEKNIDEEKIISIAKSTSEYHIQAESILNEPFGNEESIISPALDNFKDIENLGNLNNNQKQQLEKISNWTQQNFNNLKNIFKSRKERGFIKKCHGDLHLGNMTILNEKILTFDCIEFNKNFSHIDVMNDIALFLADLLEKKQDEFANIFLNEYLKITNDYEGLLVLPFYIVYKMMVRCKVMLFNQNDEGRFKKSHNWLNTANQYIEQINNKIILMHGLSGSGKSFVSKKISPKKNGIILSSDIERKRNQLEDKYNEENRNLVYIQMAKKSEFILKSNFNLIIDATFLDKKNRELFEDLAKKFNYSLYIISCNANIDVIKKRLKNDKRNYSDADIDVVKNQFSKLEDLSSKINVIVIDTNYNIDYEKILLFLK